MADFENEIIEETEQPIEEVVEIPQRVNDFCVIRKDAVIVEDINGKKHEHHDVQTNSSWGSNPYGDAYAVVPDDMVKEIQETKGFCDIELNQDGTEIVGFTAGEIPEIPEPPKEPTAEERISELEFALQTADETAIELFEMTMLQEEINNAQDNAIIEIYEMLEV